MTKLHTYCFSASLIAVLMVSGCGSDDAPPVNASATSSVPTPDVTAPPQNVQWINVHGLMVPTSMTSGPKKITGTGSAYSYEHSPQGAVLAAIGTSMRLSVATDGEWSQVVSHSVAPGPARDQWTLARAQVSVTGIDESVIPTIKGYKVAKYSDKEALIDVFSSYPDRSLTKTTVMVVWVDGDWKYVLPEDAKLENPVEEMTSLPDAIVELRKHE